MIRFLISIPEELRDDLKRLARPMGQTLTGIIRQALWDWVNAQKEAG